MQLKTVLLVISLSLSSCALFPGVPEFPEVVQYGVFADIDPHGFYGRNNKTHERVYKAFDDPSMKGAQVLDALDYKKSEAWISVVKGLASKHCH